jgi:hypothetical protein
VVLLQNRHTDVRRNRNLTAAGLKLAAENTKEGGFTRAVSTDNAIAISGCEFKINVLKKELTAKVEG